MREETRRRLERMLWLRRLKWAAAGTVGLTVLALFFLLPDLDTHVQNRRIPGVISNVGPLNGTSTKATAEGLAVDIKLDDGRMAHVMTLKTTEPHVGDHVEITEHRHGTGRVTFTWK